MDRRADRFRGWGPDVAIGLVAFAAIGLLPLALGGYVHERGFAQYALLWRELIGEAGRLPLETPKPFTTLRAALGYEAYFALAAALFALAPVFLGRLSRRLYGTRIVGVGTVLLLLLANGYFLAGPVLDGFWPLPYVGVTSLALWAFATARYGAAFTAIALAGLMRPDAWGYALLLLLLVALLDREAWRPLYMAALVCVPLWMAYDFALTSRILYSSATLDTYQEVMGVDPVAFERYWTVLIRDVGERYLVPLLAAGVLGLGVALSRATTSLERRAHVAAAGLIVLPLVGYWALSGLGDGFILHVRFFVLPLFLLPFYALALPLEGLGWWSDRRGSVPGSDGLRAAAVAVLVGLLVGIGWSRTEVWERTTTFHGLALQQRSARAEAVAYLREHWVDTDQSLLAGRSLEVFAHRLGPEAARRMLLFREVGSDFERMRNMKEGLAVYLLGDLSGYGVRFRVLREGDVMGVRSTNLRFEPVEGLEHDGETVGIIYRLRRVPEEGTS